MRIRTLHRPLGRPAHSGVLVLAVLCAMVVGGCSQGVEKQRITPILGKRVDVTVTTDGGRELVIRRSIPFKRGMTALAALRAVADVRLGPGGTVAQVNGIGGGRLTTFGPEQAGWFFRANGIEADRDPARFRVEPGMSVWWDLRRFDIYQRVPVAIGVFPQPLFSGYRDNRRPLRIAYGRDFQRDAEFFRDTVFESLDPEIESLQETGVFGGPSDDSDDGRRVPHVAVRKSRTNLVIARWEEARLDPYIADIGLDPRGYGLTTWIEGTDVRRQRVDQEFSDELRRAEGIVWASTIDGEPDSAIVVLVTGVTDEGVRAAARALAAGGFQFDLAGAVDRDGKVL